MASGETRIYSSVPGVTSEQIGNAVVNFLRNDKNQEAEGYRTETGYFIQSRSQTGGIAKAAGLGTATVVEVKTNEFGEVSVTAGAGKWSDKIGAAAVGMVVFWPLAATSAFGAVKQQQLTESVFGFVDAYVRTAQPELPASASFGAQPLMPSPAITQPSQNMVTCRNCGATVDVQAAFCPSCGSSLEKSLYCTACGAAISEGTKFCTSCGARLAQGNTCPSCGIELQEGQRFCHKCGADTQG